MHEHPGDAERARRACLIAVERSMLAAPGIVPAVPVVPASAAAGHDGADLIAFRTSPFAAVPVLVQDASRGVYVRRCFTEGPLVVACVLDPLGPMPLIAALSGAETWNLPIRYVQRGGSAGDRETIPDGYRWPVATPLLCRMLEERAATADRWAELLAQLAGG